MISAPAGWPLPEPPLSDGEVLLRAWAPADAVALAVAWADPEVTRWTGVPERADETAAGRWIAGEAERRSRRLALDLVVDVHGLVAGEVGLLAVESRLSTAEIGWWTAPHHRRRGLSARAARLLTRWALDELRFEEVVARCHPDNPASAAVARAAGFSVAGSSGDFEVWRCC